MPRHTPLLLALLALPACYQDLALFSSALPDALPVQYEPITSPTLDAAEAHTCAVRQGALYCWGENDQGQLGTGDFNPRDQATRIGQASDWAAVVVGHKHTCAARTDGTLSCWGEHSSGQLGPRLPVTDTARSAVPIEIPLPAPVANMTAGDSGSRHTCAVLVDATLWCWGDNGEAQAAQGTSNLTGVPYYTEPQRVLDVADWVDVSSSQGHVCALRASGELWCWGRNNDGECCAEDTVDGEISRPRRVPHPDGTRTWTLVETSNNHTCALDDAQELWCWGQNGNWVFGRAEPRQTFTPIKVDLSALEPGEAPVALSSDTFNMCARTNKAKAWCWGSNFSGQFGAGRTPTEEPPKDPPPMGYVPPRLSPMLVLDASVSEIVMARFYGCLRTQAGKMMCAGNSAQGRLGIPADGDKPDWLEVTFP